MKSLYNDEKPEDVRVLRQFAPQTAYWMTLITQFDPEVRHLLIESQPQSPSSLGLDPHLDP